MNRNSRTARQQHGFTIIQMLITIMIIAIVSSIGVLGIKNARAEFRLQNSARVFASYIEKARADAIRRHAEDGAESSIETFSPGGSTYAVTMDFGSGSVETRNFQLEPDLAFSTAAVKVTFDWRGRLLTPCPLTKACVFQVSSEYLKDNIPVDVSGSGDITVGDQHFPDKLIAEVVIHDVDDDVDHTDSSPTPIPIETGTPAIDASPAPEGEGDPLATPTPTPTPHGNGSDGNNGNGNGNASPTPTPAATPVLVCASSISPSTISLSQSDETNQTGTATFTMTNATGVRVISAGQAGNGNSLVVGLSLQRIDGNGSSTISVTTKNGAGNRGVFIVEVSGSPACGSTQQLTVSVSN